MKDTEPIYEGYFGYADIEEKKPIHEHSIFRQASTTKLFTYAICMMLYESGEFLLSDPLYEYLPEWRNTQKFTTLPNGEVVVVPVEKPVTIMHALTMACGMPYCHNPIPGTPVNPTLRAMNEVMTELCKDGYIPTLREEVRAMSNVPIMFEPGTHWQYGFGSEIVGALVEEITGKTVRQNMIERIIEPLGLKDTATLLDEEMAKRLVCNYAVEDGKLTKIPSEQDARILVGSVPEGSRANLNASCKDFAVFMSMLANGGVYKGERFLGRKTIELMSTNYLNEDQLKDYHNTYLAGYGYGLGFRTLMDKAGGNHNGSIGAFGWTGGTGIWAESDPVENVAIVYMHNTRPNQEEYHHLRVRAVAYGCLD
jgi:CubicO group peptidase (beta-lactamase class C family)